MKHFFTLLLVCVFSLQLSAAVGDTTVILSHINTNLDNPPSNDDIWVSFPNNKTWSKIIMKFTLGCGTPNCSGWDYTVTTSLGKKIGVDSTIASIDTVLKDTTWSYSPKMKYTQLGKLITPYGTYMANQSNGYNMQWKHPYFYDVTDYASLLKDSAVVRIRYDGYTDAFSAKIEFILIEGQPSKTVLSVDELYNVYANYPNSAGFENTVNSKSVFIPTNTTSAKINLIMTGHGSQGEFDPRTVSVDVNSAQIFSHLLWKADCGMTAIAPQGGTWIFNRANWCPGEKIDVYEIDITSFIQKGQMNTIDLNMEDFQITSGQSAGYGIGAYVITYGTQPNHDVALAEIIAPNKDANYGRFNPICGQPEVAIRNEGKFPLNQCDIAYWVEGGQKCYYQWTGSLMPFQTKKVKLPAFDWSFMDTSVRRFYAEVSWPNNKTDEYATNNLAYSNFNLVPMMDSTFVVQLKTNNHPEENSYLIRNEIGDTIFFKNSFLASKTYNDTISLSNGCYSFDLYDYDNGWEGGDGLSWWLNTQQGYETSGAISLRKLNGSLIKLFNPDFGSNIHYEFTVGFAHGFNEPKAACIPFAHNVGINEVNQDKFDFYPNPSNGKLVMTSNVSTENATILVSDYLGKIVLEKSTTITSTSPTLIEFPSSVGNGVYVIQVKCKGISKSEKVVLIR